MITIYVKRIRSYMHGFLRYRNNNKVNNKVNMGCHICNLACIRMQPAQVLLFCIKHGFHGTPRVRVVCYIILYL